MKPILFNTVMVQAILEGKKTCTRRIIKDSQCYLNKLERREVSPIEFIESGFCKNNWDDVKKIEQNFRRPFDVGDILYVRETWFEGYILDYNEDIVGKDIVLYRADDYLNKIYNEIDVEEIRWKPSIHMPKRLARIFLEVTDLRVERLQDITKDGARAEGIREYTKDGELFKYTVNEEQYKWSQMPKNPIEPFKNLWNSTVNKKDIDKYCWDSNPWVWVIEFKVKEVKR